MTAQVPAIADRADLTVTVAPGAGRGAPACFLSASAEIEVNADHLHGQADAANQRITDALGTKDTQPEPGGEEDGEGEMAS
jgi:hypothetical protein